MYKDYDDTELFLANLTKEAIAAEVQVYYSAEASGAYAEAAVLALSYSAKRMKMKDYNNDKPYLSKEGSIIPTVFVSIMLFYFFIDALIGWGVTL